MVETFKVDRSKRLFGTSMPIDKILQRMFFNFLYIIIEDRLKSSIFTCCKKSDARIAVAAVYSMLN